jgi:hypothetical protein
LEKRLRLSREIRSLFAFRLPFRIYPPAAALFQGGIRHYTGVFAALRRCNFTPLPGGFLQRSTFAALLLGLTSVTSAQEPPTAIPVQTIELQPLAAARPLPDRILGANVNLFYEKMAEDPAKVAILKTMDIGTVRFPGGTDGQFWQPQTGTFEVPLDSNASFYRKFWAAIAPRLNALHPNGIQVDEAKRFLDQIGAAMVLVPNLDTSTLQVQTSWYQKLAAQHLIPSRIEMGNEAYLAMIGDPASLKRFPDEAHYLAIAKQNLDALQPVSRRSGWRAGPWKIALKSGTTILLHSLGFRPSPCICMHASKPSLATAEEWMACGCSPPTWGASTAVSIT